MTTNNEIVIFLTLIVFPTVRAFTTLTKMGAIFNPDIKSPLVLSALEHMFTVTEAEVNAVSKVAFDVVPIILDPEDTIAIRLLAMVAKTVGVATGISNESVNYDDLAFKSVALVLSVSLFTKSFVPVLKAVVDPRTNPEKNPFYLDDRNAYKVLFEPIGLSEMHFNILNVNGAFDWIDAEPSQQIILSESERKTFKMRTDLKCLTRTVLDDNIYWLSSGSLEVMIGEQSVKQIERSEKSNVEVIVDYDDDDESDLIFGNVFGTNFVKSAEDTENTESTSTLKKWVKVGDHGAKILRINGKKVFDLIENDGKLSTVIQNLVFIGVCHELRDTSNEWTEACSSMETCVLDGECELTDSFEECVL